jgi:AraC-like DNA-binding protein
MSGPYLTLSFMKRCKTFFIEAITAAKEEIEKEIAFDKFPKKTVVELANEVGIGRNALQSGFREIYGSNIKEYMLQVRMERARQFLEEGRKTMKQIAVCCGYRSQGNFTAAFRKMYGVAPTEYQKEAELWSENLREMLKA